MAEELEKKAEVSEKDFANFVGKNADKYLPKFKKFNVDGVDQFAWTWHWPAFFFGLWWLLYRKLYVWALISSYWFFIPFWLAVSSSFSVVIGKILFLFLFIPFCFFVSSLLYGAIANYVYYEHAKKKIIKSKTTYARVDPRATAIALRKIGGVSRWILVLPPILLIFSVFASPHFTTWRFLDFPPPGMAELRLAITAQEAYFVDNSTYADSIDKLVGSEYGLFLGEGVTVVVVQADEESYEMMSFHRRGKKRYTVVGPGAEIKETDMEIEEDQWQKNLTP